MQFYICNYYVSYINTEVTIYRKTLNELVAHHNEADRNFNLKNTLIKRESNL